MSRRNLRALLKLNDSEHEMPKSVNGMLQTLLASRTQYESIHRDAIGQKRSRCNTRGHQDSSTAPYLLNKGEREL
jgi:hypothetical protein